MILTILGNNGPYPTPDGACSGYLVESDSGGTRLLLDCGTGTLARLLRLVPVEGLAAAVISHLHFDHMSDMLPMQYALQFSARERPLPVLVPERPERVRSLLECPYFDLYSHADITLQEMRLSFLPAAHPVEGSCIQIECDGTKLIFTGDTNENPALELFADGCDLLLADAGLSGADWTPKAPHLSAALCGSLARSVHAKSLLLTHFSPKYNQDELLKEASAAYPNAEIAIPGKRYRI